jgi:DNA (cytosine-5)-methyltransferase 1
MRVLDLFSGIGGFSLGLERAGMETVAFCEIDAKARLVLKKHWPEVPIYEDVSTLKGSDLHDIDVICGGFPCQDISLAGKGAGLEGERSGLWFQFHRLIKEIQPRYAVIENVSALRSRGLDQVLRSLAEIGYDAEWHCIPASAIGAPHRRDRIWIVGYPNRVSRRLPIYGGMEWNILGKTRRDQISNTAVRSSCYDSKNVAYPTSTGLERPIRSKLQRDGMRSTSGGWWAVEPNVGRVANGVPKRVDRIKQLGNAVVPQIPELIGRAIMEHENAA